MRECVAPSAGFRAEKTIKSEPNVRAARARTRSERALRYARREAAESVAVVYF